MAKAKQKEAKKIPAKRHKDDFYITPPWMTRIILPHLNQNPARVLEPCAGNGAMVRVLRKHYPQSHITAIELDPLRAESIRDQRIADVVGCHSILDPVSYQAELTLTNPPFSIILPIVEHLVSNARKVDGEVAILAKITFLATQARYQFHRRNPCDVHVLSQRGSFIEGGSDLTEYAWFVWGPGPRGRIGHLWSEEHEMETRPRKGTRNRHA